MKTRTKVALTALCALLLVAASVLGTLAYLTSVSAPVENTFTVGKVSITLDEAKTNVKGFPVNAEDAVVAIEEAPRVQGNKLHLIPGSTYTKDPTVHVSADSEKCWVFVEITDQLAAIQDTATVAAQIVANGWTELETGVYYKVVEDTDAKQDLVVFNTLKIKGEVDNTTLNSYADAKITLKAYAIQHENVDDAATAWATVNPVVNP